MKGPSSFPARLWIIFDTRKKVAKCLRNYHCYNVLEEGCDLDMT